MKGIAAYTLLADGMNIINASHLLHIKRTTVDSYTISPFVMVRYSEKSVYALWLEYSEHRQPTIEEINARPTADEKNQTKENFENLPRFSAELFKTNGNGISFRAVAKRFPIEASNIAIIPLRHGCLWTMIPK